MTQQYSDDSGNQSAFAMCLRQLLVAERTGLLFFKNPGGGGSSTKNQVFLSYTQ